MHQLVPPAQQGCETFPPPLAQPFVPPQGRCISWGGSAGPRQPERLKQVMVGARASFLVNCYPLETPVLLHASPLAQ